MRIYTRRGDTGETDLFGGVRVAKDDLRVEAYGEVDELNSCLGVCLVEIEEREVRALIQRIQHELLTLGSELARPSKSDRPRRKEKTGIQAAEVQCLEREIDRFQADISPWRGFVLPGGCPAAAQLDYARAVCRRVERRVVALHRHDPVNEHAIHYLNRLSDLLFVLARWMNKQAGIAETKWKKD